MEQIEYRIVLDVSKVGYQRQIYGVQVGEKLARKITASFCRGASVYEFPTDDTVTAAMYVTKPDGTVSINACTIDSSNESVSYDILESDITQAGELKMQLKLISTDVGNIQRVLISPSFTVEVEENSVTDSAAASTTTYTSLEKALAQAQTVYNSRITNVVVTEAGVLTIVYADGTIYTSDLYTPVIDASEAAIKSASEASESASSAASQAGSAASSASSASASADNSAAYATLAKSYAVGGTSSRVGEDTDNAKYYMEQCKDIAGADYVTRTEFGTLIESIGSMVSVDEETLIIDTTFAEDYILDGGDSSDD